MITTRGVAAAVAARWLGWPPAPDGGASDRVERLLAPAAPDRGPHPPEQRHDQSNRHERGERDQTAGGRHRQHSAGVVCGAPDPETAAAVRHRYRWRARVDLDV